jgi:hemolysin activation/secretion protein
VRQARANEQHDFTKLTAKFLRTQDLYSWTATSLDLEFGASGQWTSDILPPSEKFYLGGLDFGRGFYNGQVTGDRALTGKVELQLKDSFDVPAFGADRAVNLQYYTFYDYGMAWDVAASHDPRHHIESTGIGIKADLTEHITVLVEGVERFTRRPTGDNTNLAAEHAIYFGVAGKY